MKVGITGTRKGPTGFQFTELVRYITTRPIEEFHHGDCVGVDVAAATIAQSCGIHVVGHPPILTKARANFRSDEERPKQDYIQRNHNIVNAVDLMLVVPGEAHERRRSGTWATYRYAVQQRREIVLIATRRVPEGGKLMDADTLAEIKRRSAQAAHDATQGYDLPGWADVDALVAEVERLRAALDEIDHHTYGWTFGLAATMVDRIRLTARAALAGNQ